MKPPRLDDDTESVLAAIVLIAAIVWILLGFV